jgi:hypothetical protein
MPTESTMISVCFYLTRASVSGQTDKQGQLELSRVSLGNTAAAASRAWGALSKPVIPTYEVCW